MRSRTEFPRMCRSENFRLSTAREFWKAIRPRAFRALKASSTGWSAKSTRCTSAFFSPDIAATPPVPIVAAAACARKPAPCSCKASRSPTSARSASHRRANFLDSLALSAAHVEDRGPSVGGNPPAAEVSRRSGTRIPHARPADFNAFGRRSATNPACHFARLATGGRSLCAG